MLNEKVPKLIMKGITKRFPNVVANDGINIEVQKGEIHAIIGENGSGKSTLMSILYGIHKPDEGEIFIDGRKVDITSSTKAINLGIGMVFQHFMLIPALTVVENVILGSEPQGFILDTKVAAKEVKEISEKYGFNIDPYSKVSSISVGAQQRVEIIKTLYRKSEIIILDEPTAVLTPSEVDHLMITLKKLAAEGKTIIFISHKLREVMELSDNVTVIRSGKLIGRVRTKDTNENELAKMMVGRDVKFWVDKPNVNKGGVFFELKNVYCKNDKGALALKGINLKVREGEILGIAGVDGNGQSELMEVLTGTRKLQSGEIIIKGRTLDKVTTKRIKELKVAHVPEDRHKSGLVLDYSIEDNLILGFHNKEPISKHGILNKKAIMKNADKLIPEYDIRTPNRLVNAKNLSGGNQQKIVIAREFYCDPDILVLSQPTRGVDIGAIEFIHKRIIEMKERMKAIIVISSELSEILNLSDRIAVMYEGEIMGEVSINEATEEKLGLMMGGVRLEAI